MANQLLNFDAVTCEMVTIVKHGQTFELRDDVPFEVMVKALRFQDAPYVARLQGVETTAARLDALDDAKASMAQLVGDIFRHTLPDVTNTQIAALFTLDELQAIIKLFFLRHSARSSAQPEIPSSTMPRRRRRRH